MEDQLAHLTAEQQPLVQAVALCGVPTTRAGLARLVGVHFYRQAAREQRFVGDGALQFREGPLGGLSVGAALLRYRPLAMRALPPLAAVGLVVPADGAVR